MKKIIIFFIKVFICIFAILMVCFYFLYKNYEKKLPTIDSLLNLNENKIEILYSNSINKIKVYSNNVGNVKYSEIPQDLINALIATEDRKFFKHNGIDYLGILRAFIVNITSGSIKQGGSTITQQLAKMALNDSSKTLSRKFKEFILAKKIEKNLTKENILSLYLSKAYFGAGNYGVKSAARFYFDKELYELKLEECAMLVGLLKAPSIYNPTNNKDLTQDRTLQVIMNMKKAGFIKESDIFTYIIPDLNYSTIERYNNSQNYYFSDWIYEQLSNYDSIDRDNISIITTLDYDLQNRTNSVVNDFIKKNIEKIGKSELAVVILGKNGDILSMIGGKNYKQSQFNRAVYANRQVGSLFKLFIYLTGFENGLKINDTFIDEPIKVENWYPENNDSKYRGKISVVDAFAYSSNSVAVQIADYFGIKNVLKTANKLGLTNDFRKDLTVALGSQETNLLNITSAYATINNDGIPIFPYEIKHIIKDGNIIYKRNISYKEPIFNDVVINNIKFLLFNVITKGTGKNAKIQYLIDKTDSYNYSNYDAKFFIGGKTGTNQDYKDAWFIGYANDYTIGIWIGNDDNTPTNKITGSNLPALLWKEIVENII